MQVECKQCARVLTAVVLATFFAVPQNLLAQTAAAHVVSQSEMQRAVLNASQARQQNVERVQAFLSSEMAAKAMQSARVNPEQVKKAVSSLSDAELAELAARTQKAQADFAAGTLSDRDLLVLLLGVVALILIIVAVR